MSTRFDEEVRLGEPWTFVIDCHDASGAPFTPASATFTFGDGRPLLDGGVLIEKSSPPGVGASIPAGENKIVVTFDEPDQEGVIPGIYFARAQATPADGGPAWQAEGSVLVVAVRP